MKPAPGSTPSAPGNPDFSADSAAQLNSFPPANRLKIKAEFDYVFASPNARCSSGVLQAIYKPSLKDTPRLGLIVAKRFLPLAVQRNRVKRLIREAFRVAKPDLPPVDIIVRLARKPQGEVSAGEVGELFGKMQRSEINR